MPDTGHNFRGKQNGLLRHNESIRSIIVIQKNVNKDLRAQGEELYQIQTAAQGEFRWKPNSTCWQADEPHQHVARYTWKVSSPDVHALLSPILELPIFAVCTSRRKNEYLVVHLSVCLPFLFFRFLFHFIYLSNMSDISMWHSRKMGICYSTFTPFNSRRLDT